MESRTIKVNLSDFFWGERAWQNVPEPNSGEMVEIKAVFVIAPGADATAKGLWTGHAESSPLKVLIVNPKLKTPHEYIQNSCPREALKTMKNDGGWIRRTDHLKCTPLHHAARFGPKELVVWLVENGADVNAFGYNRSTPLYFAAAFDQLQILRYLIEKGAILEAPSNGGTPLQAAAQHKHREIVEALLDAGARYDLKTAIYLSDVEGTRTLLQQSPELAHIVEHLQSACHVGHAGIVSLLLENGADPNARGPYGPDSPLLWALGHPAVVKLLLERGADPKIQVELKGATGPTLLHEAARRGHVASARLLLDRGAEIEAVDHYKFMGDDAPDTGLTPLHVAAMTGQPEVVELLLERKADARRRTSKGQTALQLAGARIVFADDQRKREENDRYTRIVKMLAARGLEVDLFTAIALRDHARVAVILKQKPQCAGEKGSERILPLQRAVQMNDQRIVEMLLGAGADVNGIGRYGATALHDAAFWGRPAIVRLFLNRGAKINTMDAHQETALSVAKRVMLHRGPEQNYEEVIELLSRREAPH
jgi:cytohesin